MHALPLQSFDLETLALARQASEALSVLLGLAIAYIAYRGYRRNGSRPMLFVAVGFALVLGVPALLTVALYLLLSVPLPIVNALAQGCELLGLGAILYGLWTPGAS
jgi:hypothetical protein